MTQPKDKIDKILDVIIDGKASKGYHGLPDVLIKDQNDSVDFKRKFARERFIDLFIEIVPKRKNITTPETNQYYEKYENLGYNRALLDVEQAINHLRGEV